MINGEYIFYYFAASESTLSIWKPFIELEGLQVPDLYRVLLISQWWSYYKISRQPKGIDMNEVLNGVPGYDNLTDLDKEYIGINLRYLARSIFIYVAAWNLARKKNITNKLLIAQQFWNNKVIEDIPGVITLTKNGERQMDYFILGKSTQGVLEEIAEWDHDKNNFKPKAPLVWPRYKLPRDPKTCFGHMCNVQAKSTIVILTGALASIIFIFSIAGIAIFRKLKYELELANRIWLISEDAFTIQPIAKTSQKSSLNITTSSRSNSERHSQNLSLFGTHPQDMMIDGKTIVSGTYKEQTISLIFINQTVQATRKTMKTLREVSEMHHENVTLFIGACFLPDQSFFLYEYCSRKTLKDVLSDTTLELAWFIRYSLINDIVEGMIFLHQSVIQSHGRLNSSTCWIDKNFVLKISEAGLNSIIVGFITHVQELLWVAPEIVNQVSRPINGTPKGDVYSFSMILQEITLRDLPYCMMAMDINDLLSAIIEEGLRPKVPAEAFEQITLLHLMERCWAETNFSRPDFTAISIALHHIYKKEDSQRSILETLINQTETYTSNLEQLVKEKTQSFLEEKERLDVLLYKVLPISVAKQLKLGNKVLPEYYDSVTIYFSDIVGFTALAAQSTPLEVIIFLNDLYHCFDSTISNYDVYKVETIGDAYMAVSGLPVRNGNKHGPEIASMALALLNAILTFRIHHRPQMQLLLRIGLHSGPCVAGIVGTKMLRYCLFGETVHIANKMESLGEPLRIQVSEPCKQILDTFERFSIIKRGQIKLSEVSSQTVYWLLDEKTDNKMNPSTFIKAMSEDVKIEM